MTQGTQTRHSVTDWRDGVGRGWEGDSEGGDTCIPLVDSC